MTLELPKESKIPSDLSGFWRMVVDEFKNTPTVSNIETIAFELVKKEGMKSFSDNVESKDKARKQLQEFLGEKEWGEIEDMEGKRYLEADWNITGATAG